MARYDWTPFFDQLNGAINQWGQRNQVNRMIDGLSGTPASPGTPETHVASQRLSLPGGGSTMLDASVPALPATQGSQGPLTGLNPQMLQMLRSGPPQVTLPLLLQLGARERKYSMTPQYDQQGRAYVQDDQGNTKYLDGISARDKMEIVNGQAVNPYQVKPGTVIPKQNDPNQPFNSDGTPNTAYQKYVTEKERLSQAPQWANLGLAKKRLEMQEKGIIEPETLGFMADQVLAGDKSPFANIGRGAQGAENLAALRGEVMRRATARGLGGADVAALNAEFAGLQAGERTLGNRTANIEMAATEARNLMPLVLEASGKVPRTQFPSLNALLMAADQGTGGEDVVTFGVAVNGLINTYARAISPTGTPTVSDKDHARELLSRAWSAGQINAAVAQMDKEISAAQKSPGQVRGAFRSAISGRDTGHASVPDAPSEVTKTIGGKTYIQRGGKWFEQ